MWEPMTFVSLSCCCGAQNVLYGLHDSTSSHGRNLRQLSGHLGLQACPDFQCGMPVDLQIRSLHRTGSELRLSYYVKESLAADAGTRPLRMNSGGVAQLRKVFGEAARGCEGRVLQRTQSAGAASLNLDFESEQVPSPKACSPPQNTVKEAYCRS
jgi:hypothetical protein